MFIRNGTEIRKSEIHIYLCLISEDLRELGISNLTRMLLMKSYLMKQNARFSAFIIFIIRENKQRGIGLRKISRNNGNYVLTKIDYFV